MTTNWEVIALRYATAQLGADRMRLGADPHDRMQHLDYFIWVVRSGDRVILVDTGFDEVEGERRGRSLLCHPIEALSRIGLRPEDIDDILITHMHFDHAGNLDAFPNARFHLQDREMNFATGRCMCHAKMRAPFTVEHVVQAVRLVYGERVVFHDGDYTLAPGLDVHLIGGHSMGLQVLAVAGTRRVVVASDAAHLGEFLDSKDVFPAFGDYAAVLEGYRRLREIAGPEGIILPGHDPAVLRDWPRYRDDMDDIVKVG